MITRNDLSPGEQAAQAAHALASWCIEYPEYAKAWQTESQYLILLGADDPELYLNESFPCFLYREPDYDYLATSLVIGPRPDLDARNLLSSLPLMLKERAMA